MTTAVDTLSRSKRAASPPTTSNAAINVSMTSFGVDAVSSRANQTPPGTATFDAIRSRPVAIATAVLPMPPGPTISTSRSAPSRSDEGGDLRLPTDELSDRSTAGCRPRVVIGRVPARGPAERGVVDQDLSLELLQLRPGVEAELVGQLVPDPLVRGQRVGLAAGCGTAR